MVSCHRLLRSSVVTHEKSRGLLLHRRWGSRWLSPSSPLGTCRRRWASKGKRRHQGQPTPARARLPYSHTQVGRRPPAGNRPSPRSSRRNCQRQKPGPPLLPWSGILSPVGA